MHHLRRALLATMAAGLAVVTVGALAGCGAPAYSYAADKADHAYFKVPSGWHQVSPEFVAQAQNLLTRSFAGAARGALAWSQAYAAASSPSSVSLLDAANKPVVYASVQNLKLSLRGELSFNVMRDLLFPVTPGARQQAAAAGETLPGFQSISYNLITTKYNMRGINELFEYDVNGQPDAFDLTVLTNAATTKLYLLLVQCYQNCFVSNEKQIATVVNSFTVRGS